MATIIKSDGAKFVNAAAAIMALQMMQGYYALAGYLTSSSIYKPHGRVELTIHFNGKDFPKLPQGYKYTAKHITSHEYWSEASSKLERVRTIDYYFEF